MTNPTYYVVVNTASGGDLGLWKADSAEAAIAAMHADAGYDGEPDPDLLATQATISEYEADSRQTDIAIIRAINAIALQEHSTYCAQPRTAETIWQEPTEEDLLHVAADLANQDKTPAECCWGAAGYDWCRDIVSVDDGQSSWICMRDDLGDLDEVCDRLNVDGFAYSRLCGDTFGVSGPTQDSITTVLAWEESQRRWVAYP